MLFFWKKYNGDAIATFVSMSGSVLAPFLAILTAAGIFSWLGSSTLALIACIAAGIAVFIGLKFLIDKLTDLLDLRIARAQLSAAEASTMNEARKEIN